MELYYIPTMQVEIGRLYQVEQKNSLNSIYCTDTDIGYTVGDYGTILKTNNGGTIWTALTSGVTYGLSSVFFTNADTGYVVGDN